MHIGCEAYIVRDGQILLGKRGNVYGKGTWALPGGHLEFLERADDCLVRELKEEMGLSLQTSALTLLALTDDLQPDGESHAVHITFTVELGDQEPKLLEPEACDEWKWFPINALPENIFPPHRKIFNTVTSKSIYTRN